MTKSQTVLKYLIFGFGFWLGFNLSVSASANFDANSTDPLYTEQWGLFNNGYQVREDITDIKSKLRKGQVGFDVGYEKAKALIEKLVKSTVVVAVLDTGIDLEHEDLKENIFLNEQECDDGRIPLGEAKEDRDGNGYKGDCAGLNLTSIKPIERNRPFDDMGHGTHVAGIVSAISGNGLGLKGLSQHIKILPIKVISKDERRQKVLFTDRVAEAVSYAVSRGAQVINLSTGWPIGLDTPRVREVIRKAYSKGVFFVAAAGNNSHSTPIYPCAYAEVICVGATQNDGAATAFTNYGAHVDVLAPGEHILSTYPMTFVPNHYAVRGYEIKTGTSQSAPLVAAALALLRNAYSESTIEEILARLLNTTQKISEPTNRIGDLNNHDAGKNFAQEQIRLDRAFAGLTMPLPEYIRFVFKDQLVIELNSKNTFRLPLAFQNLSAKEQIVKVDIASNSTGLRFQQKQFTVKIAAWQTSQVFVDGKADSLNADRKLRFSVSFGNQKKNAQIILAQKIDQSPRLEKLVIEGSEVLKQLSLMSLTNVKGEKAGEYFGSFKKNEVGLQLSLWKRSRGMLKKVGDLSLPDLSTPVGLFVDDANNDQREDLILMGLKANSADAKLIIYYLALDLKPLWPEYPYLELTDSTPVFNFAKLGDIRLTRWLYLPAEVSPTEGLSTVKSRGLILVPSIIDDGYQPTIDQSIAERREKSRVLARHVYYLEPFKNTTGEFAGKWALRARIIDNYKWIDKIKQQLGLYFYEKVEPLTELSDESYIFLAGQLSDSKPLEVQLNSDFSWRVLSWDQNYMGYKYVTSMNLGEESSSNLGEVRPSLVTTEALFGFIAPNRAHVVFIDKNNRNQIVDNYILDLPDESENILRPLLISRSHSQIKIILEAGQKLFGFIGAPRTILKKYFSELARTTFIGQIFSQVNIPTQINSDQSVLFVDDTQMTANNIFIQQFDNSRGFYAPIKNSFMLDSNCRRLNPAKWQDNHNFRANLICRKDNQMELQSLPLH